LSNEAILVRGKGKKERYVPFGDSVKIALAGTCRRGGECSRSRRIRRHC
jgi:site-specific recombinase XerD